jgi:hypothetical protein
MNRLRNAATSFWFAGSLFAAPAPHYLLNLDFGDTADPGAQTGGNLPALGAFGGVKAADGIGDFGSAGYLQWPGFRHPHGSFTVEARLRPRASAPLSTRYISDVANTATWDTGPNQGFFFRIGGGYLYPVLPRNAYAADSLYARSLYYDDTQRAFLSRCLGEFGFGTGGGWLETFTDRCVDLDRWTYFVAVWDGRDARVYLNGFEATDTWRRNGVGSRPTFDSTVLLTVGARYGQSYDQRHFDGSLDFIRILDTAMSDAQIRQRYLEVSRPDSGSACRGRVLPRTPRAGEFCDSGCAFRFGLEPEGDCPDPGRFSSLHKGDSVEIEISHDPGFQDPFLHVVLGDSGFILGPRPADPHGSDAACYWRGRLKPGAGAAAKRAADAAPGDWSEPKPFLLGAGDPVRLVPGGAEGSLRMRAVAGGYLLEGAAGSRPPRLAGADGRVWAQGTARGRDGWFLPWRGAHGVCLLKTAQGAYRLAL